MPRLEVDPSISHAFTAELSPSVEASQGKVRIESPSLLEVRQVPRGVIRTYSRYFMTPEDGGRFFLNARAYFIRGARLPELAGAAVDSNRRLRGLLTLSSSEIDNIQMLVVQGDNLRLTQDVNGVCIAARINRLQDRIEALSIRVGDIGSRHEYVSSGIIDSIPTHKANPGAYLRDHGVFPDRETGRVELRTSSGWTVSYKDIVPTEDVLDRLYPEELRSDHFGAPSEFDGWAGADFATAFGITITPPAVENPIFVNPASSQSQ